MYPTVTADREFKALHGTQLHTFARGQEVGGELAAYLAATGAPVTVTDAGGDVVADKPLAKMTAKELKAYAAELGVDLGGASKKADVLAALKAHAGTGDAGGDAVADEPLAKMTAKELKAYAAELGVDLGGASKKADVLAALKAHAGVDHEDGGDDGADVEGDEDGDDADGVAGDAG